MTTLETFKNGPAREILNRIGFDISTCLSWSDYRSKFIEQNRAMRDKSPDDDCLGIRAYNLSGILSTGERAILCAALAAADFAAIADEFWSWSVVDRLDFRYREAVAAAVLRKDAA